MAAIPEAPLFLLPTQSTNFPHLFMERLTEAASVQHIIAPNSFLMIAIDAVGEACTGLEAVKMAKKLRPDVLLLDLATPRHAGLEALAK
jgi:DNA-binding NarL/FixJ family response regulator